MAIGTQQTQYMEQSLDYNNTLRHVRGWKPDKNFMNETKSVD
jgi:hypothetical protein